MKLIRTEDTAGSNDGISDKTQGDDQWVVSRYAPDLYCAVVYFKTGKMRAGNNHLRTS